MPDVLDPIEFKAVGDAGEIEGYASTFGNRDLVGDIVQPGAFAKTLNGRPASDVLMLWNHEHKRLIGVWDEIEEDAIGLRVKGRILIETKDGADAYAFAKARAARGLSIGYRTVRARHDPERKSRLLDEVALTEISVLAVQANPRARIGNVKSHDPDRARRLVAQLNAAAAALRA